MLIYVLKILQSLTLQWVWHSQFYIFWQSRSWRWTKNALHLNFTMVNTKNNILQRHTGKYRRHQKHRNCVTSHPAVTACQDTCYKKK